MPLNALTKYDFTPKTLDEAGKAFGKKAALTSDLFERLSVEAKAHAFRIANVHKAGLIQRARDIVEKAIREGTPFPEVRRELLALFDTEGIPRPALARLRTMFQQNVQQAYNDARRETLETYVKRLEKLEQVADGFDGVVKSYAIQAGREIRIMVSHKKVDDSVAVDLAYEISRKVEKELEYPGQIKVVVIRETRAVDYAK